MFIFSSGRGDAVALLSKIEDKHISIVNSKILLSLIFHNLCYLGIYFYRFNHFFSVSFSLAPTRSRPLTSSVSGNPFPGR